MVGEDPGRPSRPVADAIYGTDSERFFDYVRTNIMLGPPDHLIHEA